MDKKITATITLTVDQLQTLSDLVGKEIISLRNEEAPNAPMRISSKVGLCWDGMSEKAIGMNALWEVVTKAKINAELDAEMAEDEMPVPEDMPDPYEDDIREQWESYTQGKPLTDDLLECVYNQMYALLESGRFTDEEAIEGAVKVVADRLSSDLH